LSIDPDFELLFRNMLGADARHLYSLPEWDQVLSAGKREEIRKDFNRSRIYHAPKKPGRNDPCPCGSGKKYKNCCMKKDQEAQRLSQA
ncbi:MAG TPA: SEC-C domain-containing protein, partial [Eubacterium sp.]|nr:SEC-C domain-containing protein [Eubacterium sp.]